MMATQLSAPGSAAMGLCSICLRQAAAASSSSTQSLQFNRTSSHLISIPAKLPAKLVSRSRPHRRSMAFGISAAQAEFERLQADYTSLLNLGRKYGKFDREGKVSYIKEMKHLIGRWQVFVKRMELVDDYAAKTAVHKLRSEMGPLGLSSMDLADSLSVVLDEMKKDAEAEAETMVI